MKKNYIFLLFTIAFAQVYGQSKCLDAHQDLVYAYSHVKTAYDSNNHTHLKHFSERSFQAFERAKTVLQNCDCQEAYNLAYDSAELLAKVAPTETFEDGRFYVKRARDIAQKTINELEICTKRSSEDNQLADLENEKLKLEQQQIELRLKEEKIKLQLAEQQQKEMRLKKEQLISTNEIALSTNINAYNEMLSACGCTADISSTNTTQTDMLSRSLDQIKGYYINAAKNLATSYLNKLNQCK